MTISQPPTQESSLLDQPAIMAFRLNWEKIAWTVLLLLALLLRLYDVGARTMSHDESLHTTYSHHLYSGVGFKHDPLMHGPFLFHATAASYFLFGPSDFSARLPVVLLGVAVVWLMWLTRSWIGRWGAFLAAAMMAFSPTLLYHSRYIRHDLYAIFFLLAMAILAFRYIDRGEGKWLMLMAAALGLSFTTKEVSFISAVIFVGFFLIWTLVRLLMGSWEDKRLRWPFFILMAVGGLLALYPLWEAVHAPVGQPVSSERLGGMVLWPMLLVGFVILALAFLLLWMGYGKERLLAQRDTEVMIWVLTLSAPLFAAFPIKLLGGNPTSINVSSMQSLLTPQTLQGGIVFLVMLLIFSGVGFLWGRTRYLAGLGIFYGVMLIFFTTFFTNGNGVATGLVGSVGYWLAQQEVARGSQPWFYYFLLVPLYEFLPLILSAFGLVSIAVSEFKKRPYDEYTTETAYPVRRQWLLYVVWWTLATWGAFTWAGEKMPWLTTHFTVPMAILGGWYLGRRVVTVEWRQIGRSGAWWLLVLIPLWGAVLIAFVRVLQRGPFRGSDLNAMSDTMAFLASLGLLLALSWLLYRQIRKVGGSTARQMVFFSLIAILSFFSIRTAFLASYVNYDLAVEPLVYAHGSPDVKQVVEQLHDISRRTVGEGQLAFAYDNETTWPFEWYFRDFPNKKFFGASPSRDVLRDAPVVLVGTENEDKVKPYLGDDYYRIPYRQIWWPKETYKRLVDGETQPDGTVLRGVPLLLQWSRDPQAVRNFWDILLYRRYQQPLAEWDPSDRFLMFVRKDIAAQIWDLGAPPATIVETEADPFAEKVRLENAIQIVGGSQGSGPGQMQQPRNAVVGPDGRLYVADTGNHRIVVYNPDGSFAFEWGGFGEGPGQFNEPWGMGIAADGSVFVADTWNHRVQVFDATGTYLREWGGFVSTDGQLGQLGVFWGPRAIAIDDQGNVLVTDTGNKRVQVFDQEGNGITQFGGGGLESGRFEEPVGITLDTEGNVYVADTWNQRVQVFDPQYQYLREWPVPGWDDEGIFHKPYLAVDSVGRVYAADPTSWRILVWDNMGNPQAALGQYGTGSNEFAFPVGVSVTADDMLWVTDADNHRVMQFALTP